MREKRKQGSWTWQRWYAMLTSGEVRLVQRGPRHLCGTFVVLLRLVKGMEGEENGEVLCVSLVSKVTRSVEKIDRGLGVCGEVQEGLML